jgi:hypothetical protein
LSDQLVAETATYTTHNKEKGRTVHAISGIRARDSSNRAAADLRLRTKGHRNRPLPLPLFQNVSGALNLLLDIDDVVVSCVVTISCEHLLYTNVVPSFFS